MITGFFKSQQPLAYPAMAFFTLIFWITGYFECFTIYNGQAMPLYHVLFNAVNPGNKFFYFFLSLALVMSQAIYLNIIANKYDVLYKNSFLPGLFYVVLMSSIPEFISFHPVLIINSILIIVLDKTFRLYKNDAPLALDFDICALLSLMTMIYLPSLIFVLLFIMSLIILRPFSWRDYAVGFIGFITPVFFILLYYFLTDRLPEIKNLLFTSEISRKFDIKNAVPPGYPLTILWVTAIFFLSFIKLRKNFQKNAAKTRSYQLIILFLLFISLLMIIFTPTEMLFRFSVLCAPLSIIIAYYFLAAKRIWITELLFYLLLVSMVYNYASIK